MRQLLVFGFLLVFTSQLCAQTDSAQKQGGHVYSHRDSLYLYKLNNNGNLMIAGGVGLCLVGGVLIYEGSKIYATPDSTAAGLNRNHNQGTAYYVAGGFAIAGGIVLAALGVKNKIEFKRRKKYMSLQAGWLRDGSLGAELSF